MPQIDEQLMGRLVELAGPLLSHAAEHAFVRIDETAQPEDVMASKMVMGFTMSVQALLRCAPWSELGIFAALGTVAGVVMVQCQTDRNACWDAMRAQMSRVIGELMAESAILAQTEPAGEA